MKLYRDFQSFTHQCSFTHSLTHPITRFFEQTDIQQASQLRERLARQNSDFSPGRSCNLTVPSWFAFSSPPSPPRPPSSSRYSSTMDCLVFARLVTVRSGCRCRRCQRHFSSVTDLSTPLQLHPISRSSRSARTETEEMAFFLTPLKNDSAGEATKTTIFLQLGEVAENLSEKRRKMRPDSTRLHFT